MTPNWDPNQYHLFQEFRSRPFWDLVQRIEISNPDLVVDLGCGSGELGLSAAKRWEAGKFIGVDQSGDMISAAEKQANKASRTIPEWSFEVESLTTWEPDEPVNVILANASLQWVSQHVDLFERFHSWLCRDGCLAFQVPGNFDAPSHTILSELRRSPQWSGKLGEGADRTSSVRDPMEYAALLTDLGFEVDAWETTYCHLLSGENPVLEWVKGTGLRPVLEILNSGETGEFLELYGARLIDAYPPRPDGMTPFPFRRIFVVARKKEG